MSLDATRNIYAQLEVQFPAQLAYFSMGVLLQLYFDKLKSHFLGISLITLCLFLLDQFFTGDLLDVFWISGFVFVFGFWRYFGEFAKYGDFSYGTYIVHWPILQVLIVLGALKFGPVVFFLLAVSLVAIAAILMWYLVERKFLASSNHYRSASTQAPV
jgi:peptidoglycan/LPS O-acetylase OafA/YrhL